MNYEKDEPIQIGKIKSVAIESEENKESWMRSVGRCNNNVKCAFKPPTENIMNIHERDEHRQVARLFM